MAGAAHAGTGESRPTSWASLAAFWIVAIGGAYTPQIAPVVISAVIDRFHLPEAKAGWLASAEIAGTAVGAFAVAMLIRSLKPRLVVAGAAGVAVLAHLASLMVGDYAAFLALRFVAGGTAGVLLAMSAAALGATAAPERNFAILTAVAYLAGAAGLRLLPGLAQAHGIAAIYLTTAGLALVGMVCALGFPKTAPARHVPDAAAPPADKGPLILAGLAMLALFFAFGGVWPFMARMGAEIGVAGPAVAKTLALSAVAAWIASVVAIILGARIGRLIPLGVSAAGICLGLIALWARPDAGVFAWTPLAFMFSINLAIPYLMGGVAALDKGGRLIAISIALQDVGLAAGPLVAGLLIAHGGLSAMVWTGVAGGIATPILFWLAFRLARGVR